MESMELVRYVAPGGTGQGLTRDDPGNVPTMLPWAIAEINEQHYRHDVRVVLLDGEYTDQLWLNDVGYVGKSKTLTIEGMSASGAVLLSLSNGNLADGTVQLNDCRSILLRRLHFRQVLNPTVRGAGHLDIRNSADIRVEACTWEDLDVGYAAAAVTEKSQLVLFVDCKFSRLWGLEPPDGGGNHMVYVQRQGSDHELFQVHFVNCTFIDNYGGSFLKLRGASDCSISDCTFVNSALLSRTWPGPSRKFIQFAKYENDLLCKKIYVLQNRFINISRDEVGAIWSFPSGSDPVDSRFQSNISIGNVTDAND